MTNPNDLADAARYVLEAIGLRCVTNMMRVDLRGNEVPF